MARLRDYVSHTNFNIQWLKPFSTNQNSETERQKHRKDYMILAQAMAFSKVSSRSGNKGKIKKLQKNNSSTDERVATHAGEDT